MQTVEYTQEPTVQQNVEDTNVTDEFEAPGIQEVTAAETYTQEPTETSTPEIRGVPSTLVIAYRSFATCSLDIGVEGYLELGSGCFDTFEGNVPSDIKALSSYLSVPQGGSLNLLISNPGDGVELYIPEDEPEEGKYNAGIYQDSEGNQYALFGSPATDGLPIGIYIGRIGVRNQETDFGILELEVKLYEPTQTNDGSGSGGSGDGDSCPADRQKPDGGCCPAGTVYNPVLGCVDDGPG